MRNFTYFEDSPVEATPIPPTFEGLWIHYPTTPQASSRNFRFGKNARSYEFDIESSEMTFAGREFNVVEFGEHREDSFDCKVLIPHGPAYNEERDILRSFASSRATVVVRDNRGHVVFGAISSLSESHVHEGSDFTFTVNRVHREIWEII